MGVVYGFCERCNIFSVVLRVELFSSKELEYGPGIVVILGDSFPLV